MLSIMVGSQTKTMGVWQVPRLRAEQRWLGGVAAGLARELGVEPLLIRLAFVLLALSSGIGLALYAGAWLWFTYAAQAHPTGALYEPVPKARSPRRRLVGVASVVLGLVVLARRAQPTGVDKTATWPVAVAAFGLLLAWSSGKVDWSEPRELVRAGGGLLLIAGGVLAFIVLNLGSGVAPKALLVATGVLSLVVVVVAPWLWRAASQVSEQRVERTRAEERAELAAHLHDSVLQTLSLITRNADDPAVTRQLARRQERDLRRWLFERSTERATTELFRGALTRVAEEVEDQHGVPIETVVVGDGPVQQEHSAIVGATREALVNAAQHSGAPVIDLYGEMGPSGFEVYIRDKGRGFDPSEVAEDRRGLSESIHGRMSRAGGHASVVSEPGQGTEVTLTLALAGPSDASNEAVK